MPNHTYDHHISIDACTAKRQFVLISRHETIGKAQHGMLAKQIARTMSRKEVQ